LSKKEFKEYEEYEEYKERIQEPESRSQEVLGQEGGPRRKRPLC
jgi:hypothetical protein